MNELGERIEGSVITRTFNVSGMPLTAWTEVNQFCIDNFGDSRWTMVYSLMKATKEDFKYTLLFDEIEALKIKVAGLEKPQQGINVNQGTKTFGMRKGSDGNE